MLKRDILLHECLGLIIYLFRLYVYMILLWNTELTITSMNDIY